MRKNYCPFCDVYRETLLIPKKETFNVKGEGIAITCRVSVCSKCKRDVFDEEIDEKNLQLAYNKYRKRHKLLLPKEIREIREKYGLSQRALGRLLGWGEITVNRYEQGCIQDNAHNDILEFISAPKNMLKIYEKKKHLLSSNARISLLKTIDKLISGFPDIIDIKVKTIRDDTRKYNWTSTGGLNECKGILLLGDKLEFLPELKGVV